MNLSMSVTNLPSILRSMVQKFFIFSLNRNFTLGSRLRFCINSGSALAYKEEFLTFFNIFPLNPIPFRSTFDYLINLDVWVQGNFNLGNRKSPHFTFGCKYVWSPKHFQPNAKKSEWLRFLLLTSQVKSWNSCFLLYASKVEHRVAFCILPYLQTLADNKDYCELFGLNSPGYLLYYYVAIYGFS